MLGSATLSSETVSINLSVTSAIFYKLIRSESSASERSPRLSHRILREIWVASKNSLTFSSNISGVIYLSTFTAWSSWTGLPNSFLIDSLSLWNTQAQNSPWSKWSINSVKHLSYSISTNQNQTLVAVKQKIKSRLIIWSEAGVSSDFSWSKAGADLTSSWNSSIQSFSKIEAKLSRDI